MTVQPRSLYLRARAAVSHPGASRARGYALVALGAALWGSLGLFYQVVIGRYGLSSLEAVFWRALIASVILGSALARTEPGAFRVARRDYLLMLALGAIGVAATFWIYAYAIRAVGMGIAAVLQYIAPAWVTLFCAAFWGEKLSVTRVVALVLALSGVALVGQITQMQSSQLSVIGIAAALATSVTYAAYVLMIKAASDRGYSPRTILFFGLVIGTTCLATLQTSHSLTVISTQPGVIPWLIALGLVTLGAGVAFNTGLRQVPASNASIIATIEPLTAMLLGWAVLGEHLSLLQAVGAFCILGSVSILQIRGRQARSAQDASSSTSR